MSENSKIPSARSKMSEAQFFYWKIVRAAEISSTEPPEAFDHYLSAFLGAANSVVDVAQFELRGRSLITEWEGARLSDEDRVFLRAMENSRNSEMHRTGIEVKKQPNFFDPAPALGGRPLIPERFLVAGDRQYGVMTACGRYLGLLVDMMQYVETHASPRPR